MPQLSKAKLKFFASLLQKKYRQQEGLFLAEGIKALDEALRSPLEVVAVIHLPKLYPSIPSELPFEKALEATSEQFKRLSSQVQPEGVLTVLRIPPSPIFQITDSLVDAPNGPAFLLDDVRDPGNLGTILRTADWFGFEQVICSAQTVDAFNPKVVRAAMGSLFRLRIAYLSDFSGFVRKNAQRIWMADMEGSPLGEAELPKRNMILMGNEPRGLRPEFREMEEIAALTIPRIGQAESLNVGVAAGIIAAQWRMQKGEEIS